MVSRGKSQGQGPSGVGGTAVSRCMAQGHDCLCWIQRPGTANRTLEIWSTNDLLNNLEQITSLFWISVPSLQNDPSAQNKPLGVILKPLHVLAFTEII